MISEEQIKTLNTRKDKLYKLDNNLENQNEFSKIVLDLINNLDFEDSESKEKQEEKGTEDNSSSSSENNKEDNNLSQKEENSHENSDLKIPDISLMRTKTIIIHYNLKKKIYYILNCFADEQIDNYKN